MLAEPVPAPAGEDLVVQPATAIAAAATPENFNALLRDIAIINPLRIRFVLTRMLKWIIVTVASLSRFYITYSYLM